MGVLIRFPPHGRASAGSRAEAAKSAKVSSVTFTPFSPAMRTSAAQWGAGMPFGRVLHPLTVESESDNAAATSPVPPSASMIDPGVMAPLIVRTVRTSQGFAGRETTFLGPHVPIGAMLVDPPQVIGARLKALRLALEVETQTKFAEAIGVEKHTYNPWEKGTRPLTFEGACLIRQKFKIPLDYLFFGEIGDLPVRLHRKLVA